MTGARESLRELLSARLDERARAWLAESERAVGAQAAGPSPAFAALISQASRRVPRGALAPTASELARADSVVEGWNPERWTILDAARAMLVLARTDLATAAGFAAIEDCFAYADVGEMCSLHRALCLLPDPRRFVARAGEGCRSSMRVVYEAAACDTPLPARFFDGAAFRQLAIKAVFVGAPLWRVVGLDARVDPELARMALDLVEERRAAGRRVQPELWLCIGAHGGTRGEQSLLSELAGDWAPGRRAAALALTRAGRTNAPREMALRAALARESDLTTRATIETAIAESARGAAIPQTAWFDLHGLE